VKRLILLLAALPVMAARPDFSALDRFLEEACAPLRNPLPPAGIIDPAMAADAAKPRSGCAVLLVRDGRIIHRKSVAGFDPAEYVTIASATKWMTAALLMTFVDEGRLSLDDPAAKFFPELTGDAAKITIRQMFSHTSGLPPSGRNHKCVVNGELGSAECAKQVLAQPLAGPPGAVFAYGANSMNVAGRVMEIVGGKPIAELFADRLAKPLGVRTHLAYPKREQPQIAAGMSSNAEDYAKFLAMILARGKANGRRILSEKAIAEMERDQTRGARILFTPYVRVEGMDPDTRYGIGVWLEEKDPGGAGVIIGSQGAWGWSPWVDRAHNVAGVFATVSRFGEITPAYTRVKELVREALPPARPEFARIDRYLDDACAKLQKPPLAATAGRIDKKMAADVAAAPGGCAAAILREGKEVHRHVAAGFDPARPIPIASASKWMMGALLMASVDRGEVALDDTVAKYFAQAPAAVAGATLRQLFSHTSGLPGSAGNPDCAINGAGTFASCAAEILQFTLFAEPGKVFAYGGNSMNVGGRILEIAAKRPLADLFDERLVKPLGLASTALAYSRRDHPRVEAGVQSTLDDYLRFLEMLLANGRFRGRRVLSARAVEEIERDQTRGAKIAFSPWVQIKGVESRSAEFRYGLGAWLERQAPDGRGLEISSPGAWGFCPWIDRERGIAALLATVHSFAEVAPLYQGLQRRVRAQFPPRRANS
jgi:CubicO group peptidase (beta-lactamase class C family)